MADKKKVDRSRKQKIAWNSLVTVAGETMTVEERNRRMKLEYVNGGISLKDLGIKYGVSYARIRAISCEEKWGEYKEKFKAQISDEVEKQLSGIYVSTQVDVNIIYNNAWQLLVQEVVRALNNKDGLKNAKGEIDWYKVNQLADVLTKAHSGQQLTTGFITREAQAKIDIQRESLDVRKQLVGLVEDEIIKDNFLEALNASAKRCGISIVEEDTETKEGE